MTQKSIKKLAELYHEMSQAETGEKEKQRLLETKEALKKLLSVSGYLDGLCEEVQELLDCDILTDECDLAVSLKGWKKQVLK